jgi:hypothetical protein
MWWVPCIGDRAGQSLRVSLDELIAPLTRPGMDDRRHRRIEGLSPRSP